MQKRIYTLIRDLHLYLGLFCAPFILVFAGSAILFVHSWAAPEGEAASPRTITGVVAPGNLASLAGRARVDALRGVLDRLGVQGEVGFITHMVARHRLLIPVSVPGRETMVEINTETGAATVESRNTGIRDALVKLHKAPGPHLADIRMNWFPMRAWQWFADGTVYLLFFLSFSGIYLWAVLRGERRVGLALIAAGACSFLGIAYAICR